MRAFVSAWIVAIIGAGAAAFAGDVKVTVKHGSLFVKGSDAADVLSISATGAPGGDVDVAPNSGLGTTVNGSSSAFHATGITRDLFVDLRGGIDDLSIGASGVRDVHVDLGAGDDFQIGRAHV